MDTVAGGLGPAAGEFGLSHPMVGSNGMNRSIMPHVNNDQDAKRIMMEQSGVEIKPSRVIHIRNIREDVTEAEIITLGIPFGRVTNVLVLKGKNQVSLPSL